MSQFLSKNQQLHLAGIGTFELDNSGTITFHQDASTREDINLVNFIAEQTGKMKSLISADLDSHLELARQFLNIGKPYLFEGIGTLNKNKTGKFDFVQTTIVTERTKESHGEGRDMTSTTENSFTDYEEMFSPKKPKAPIAKKLATWVVAIAGLSLAVFGGYMVYTNSKKKKPETANKASEPTVNSQLKEEPAGSKDTTTQQVVTTPLKPADGSKVYRFVIEKAAKQRALYRYSFLKKNFIDVKMDTKDSILFKLYFELPSSPADTARKRDSLQRLYSTRGKATIEFN